MIALVSLTLIAADAGRVEVEGVILRAGARRLPSNGFPDRVDYEVEFSATSKGGGELPSIRFTEPVRVVRADGAAISKADQFGHSDTPQSRDTGHWSTRLTFDEALGATVPAIEGTVAVAPTQWRTVVFDRSPIKPNMSVPIDGGVAKLIVLDLDEGTDVRFRVSQPAMGTHEPMIQGAQLTMVDVQGKESVLTASGSGYSSNGKTTEHSFRFRGNKPTTGALKGLRLEIPTSKGPEKKIRFRILEAPVEEWNAKRRAER